MIIEDNEMIDAAMDAAEVQIAEKSVAEEVAHEVLAADQRVKEEKEPSKARDKSGKFTKSGNEASSEDVSAKPEEEQEEVLGQDANVPDNGVESQEAQANSILSTEASAFWPAALKEAIAKGTKEDVVKHFAALDQQRNEWAYSKEREGAEGKAIKQKFSETFPQEVVDHMYTHYGIKDPFEATGRLLAWNKVIENDPRGAIISLMQKNRITLEELANGDFESEEDIADSRIAEIQAKAEAAEARVAEMESRQQQEKLLSEVNTFKNGVDEYGNVRAKFCETYAPQIDQVAKQAQELATQNGYNASLTEILDYAYKAVYQQISDLHGIKPGQPRQAVSQEQVIANAKKANAAASKSSGAPISGQATQKTRLKGKTFEDKLTEAVDISLDQHGY